MRTREELETERENYLKRSGYDFWKSTMQVQSLEVLLDIRDLLRKEKV